MANGQEQLPIDFELYLPRCWTDDVARRHEAHLPETVVFKTKGDLALEMIERAARNGVPGSIVLMDAGYGNHHALREAIALLGFRPVHWREGTRRTLSSRFALRRVRVAHKDGIPIEEHKPVWLLIEWPEGERKPTKFTLTTLPSRMRKKDIIRLVKERFRTEQAYEEMKEELGLDHFEGRSFPGWHHHVTVVLSCYAFVVAERARHFPPSALRTGRTHPYDRSTSPARP